jgi:hypothetical protein
MGELRDIFELGFERDALIAREKESGLNDAQQKRLDYINNLQPPIGDERNKLQNEAREKIGHQIGMFIPNPKLCGPDIYGAKIDTYQ